MYSFDKTRRLLNKADYDYVFSQAKKITTQEFIILYRENNIGHARLGLAIAKKKVAKAHDRNYIKRIFRESFRMSSLPAVDIVILAKINILHASKLITIESLIKAWDKLRTK